MNYDPAAWDRKIAAIVAACDAQHSARLAAYRREVRGACAWLAVATLATLAAAILRLCV